MVAVCFKCRQADGVVVNRDGSLSKLYCAECFTEFLTRSIRDQLFSNCLLPCDLPVAVGVSGGPNSLLLLHQLGLLRAQNAMRQGAGYVRFILLPFHLDERELVLPPPSETAPAEAFRQTMLNQFQRLEALYTQQPTTWCWADVPLFTPEELPVFRYSDLLTPAALATLRAYLHHAKLSLTDREELYDSVKRSVMYRIAAHLCRLFYMREDSAVSALPQAAVSASGHSSSPSPREPRMHTQPKNSLWCHLLTAENAVRCAVAALQCIVKGETGDGLIHKAGHRALGAYGVVHLRPLRNVLPREAVLYGRLHHIQSSYSPSLSTCTSLRSMHRTLESFVLQLHTHYRTALFNVLTMTSKMESSDPIVETIARGELRELATRDAAEPPVIDPPVKKPRPDVCPTDAEQTPRATSKKSKNKSMGGRPAQYYRDACLATSPPVTMVASSSSATLGAEGGSHVRLCLVCGCPNNVASTTNLKTGMDDGQVHSAAVQVYAVAEGVCVRCVRELDQLSAAGVVIPDACTDQDNGEGAPGQFDQLLILVKALAGESACDEPPRLVKSFLSEADKAAFLLPEDDE